MKAKFQIYKNYFVNLIFPALIFGSITGILTSVIVTLFKLCAKYVISFSQTMLSTLKERVYLIPIALIIVFGLSVLIDLILKKEPNLRGGGIPTSISALRGITVLNWFKALLGGFFLPLISFAFGVPLGTEGPSVLIGTATGKGSVRVLASKHGAWNKYAMTGGASAGFSVATGSPIAGIMFAIEEVHGRISPMIIMVATISVAFSRLTSELLDKISFLNVDIQLFPKLTSIQPLGMINVWIPIVVAIVIGLLAVVFLYYYRAVYTFFNKALIKVPSYVRIFIVFALSIIAGVISFNYVSTGHHLIEEILTNSTITIGTLLLILLVRSTLTLSANTNSINGGMFIPIMALGAVASSTIAKIMISLGVSESYYTLIVVIGITACISSMMKTPLAAIVFAIEALACDDNILFVIITSIIAYMITEIFRAKSINDTIIERRSEEIYGERAPELVELTVTIKENSFAIGKQIRDIFWPRGLKVLSVHREQDQNEIDKYAESTLNKGDILQVRYSTTDKEATQEELYAIVGNQDK